MSKDVLLNEPWLKWAIEIQAIAQTGLTYTKDKFDIERYEQLRSISAEMLSYKTAIPTAIITSLFCNEEGYQTPKLDTRAAIFKDEKILLVQEMNGTWSLPGGWVDVLESIASNTMKEVKQDYMCSQNILSQFKIETNTIVQYTHLEYVKYSCYVN